MKDVTEAYIAKEEATVRKPVELYYIWYGSGDGLTEYFYTNGDVSVTYDGDVYAPATIKRGSTEYNSSLDAHVMKVQFSTANTILAQYIAQNPIDIVWIEISRLFRDQDPLEASVVFIGQIKSVSFKGVMAEAECVGFEHFLKMGIPKLRYQINCNHRLFDGQCGEGLTKADWKVSAEVTLDATKTILTAAAFGEEDDGYFTGGLVEFEGEKRTVTDHTGTAITLNFKMVNLVSTDTVDVYPGCDGRIETCRDKFDNEANFLGFPFIPQDNPAIRT